MPYQEDSAVQIMSSKNIEYCKCPDILLIDDDPFILRAVK
jgi:hypothetical protein